MTPCVAYARVSSEEQAKAGYSIPHQKSRIADYAKRNGLRIDAWFVEAHSARNTGRPEFKAMVAHLAENQDIRTVLVHKQDRISRNLTDWALLTEALKIRVIPVEEPVTDTPMGWLTQTFGAAMAKFYSDNLSAEVRKGIRAKFEAGGFPTRAPFGYRHVSRTRTEKARVEVNLDTAPAAVRMFKRYATGHVSLADLALELYDLGHRTRTGRPFSPDYVQHLLKHPFYKGLTQYQGEVRPGVHEPIISVDLWDRVQETLVARRRSCGEKGSKFFLLRGLLSCGRCGRHMTAEEHERGSYYRCVPDNRRSACGAPLVPVFALNDQVVELFRALELPPAFVADVVAELQRMAATETAGREAALRRLEPRETHLRAKLARLVEGFADGDVPVEEYRRLRTALQHELDSVVAERERLHGDPTVDAAAAQQLVEQAGALRRLYALAAEPEDRKALLRHVYRRITVTDKAITGIEYNPPFDLLLGDASQHAGSRTDVARSLLTAVATR
jgi:site-specific DNA recombinase